MSAVSPASVAVDLDPRPARRWRLAAASFCLAACLATGWARPAHADAAVTHPASADATPGTGRLHAAPQSPLVLDGRTLELGDVVAVARRAMPVAISPQAWRRVERSHALLLAYARLGRPVYGLNRGVGLNKDQTIFVGDAVTPQARSLSEAFNHRMLLSHTVAYGAPASVDTVRAAMLIRLNTALYGGTGMSPALVRQYVEFLNHGITPVVLGEGSVGQADITILPQIGLAMMGEGRVTVNGREQDAAAALDEAGLQPARPYAKDALSIVSSNAYGAALAILASRDARVLVERADAVAALSLEGLNGNVAPLLPVAQDQRPYAGQGQSARHVLSLLRGSALWQTDVHRALQDPLSFRTVSQVHGALREALDTLDARLALQINSSDDNPTVVLDAVPPAEVSPQEAGYYVTQGQARGAVVPSAGFDPTVWALPLETVGVALSQVAQSSAQRILRLGDPGFTHLSRFLSPDGIALAYTTIQKPVSVLTSEIRALAHPVSSDALALAGQIEDVATNAPLAAQRLRRQLTLLQTLTGIELMHAAQAVDLRRRADPKRPIGSGTGALLRDFRRHVGFLAEDRRLATDIEQARRYMARPSSAATLDQAGG